MQLCPQAILVYPGWVYTRNETLPWWATESMMPSAGGSQHRGCNGLWNRRDPRKRGRGSDWQRPLPLLESLRIARKCRGVIMRNFYGTLVVDACGIVLAAMGFLNPLLARLHSREFRARVHSQLHAYVAAAQLSRLSKFGSGTGRSRDMLLSRYSKAKGIRLSI